MPSLVAQQVKNNKTTVQKQKQEKRSSIRKNSKKLEQTIAETKKKLRELTFIDQEINSANKEIATLEGNIDSLNNEIKLIEDTIKDYSTRLDNLSNKYAQALRHGQGNFQIISGLAYLFSSKNVSEVSRKYRALKQFGKWRKNKAVEITSLKENLILRQQYLDSLLSNQSKNLKILDQKRENLSLSLEANKKIINNLKQNESQLKRIIQNDKQELDKLDKELEKIIAREAAEEEKRRLEEERKRKTEEQLRKQQEQVNTKQSKEDSELEKKNPRNNSKKNSDQKKDIVEITNQDITSRNASQLTDGFLKSKGKLPYPVDGSHIIVRSFGRQKHPDLPMIETDNPGIDISVNRGSLARAIYEGTISAIFRQPGYNNVVMIRHGNYITIYANLDDIQVKKGERVPAGKALGKIAVDQDDVHGRSIIHFEIRNEKTKENPVLWLHP